MWLTVCKAFKPSGENSSHFFGGVLPKDTLRGPEEQEVQPPEPQLPHI